MKTSSLLIAAILMQASLAHGGETRYVDCTDGNDGQSGTTLQDAWKTIQWAADTVNSGDLVNVTGGPCTEGNITFDRSALSGPGDCRTGDSQCTIFRGDAGKTAVLPASHGQDGFIIEDGVDGLKFEHFALGLTGSALFNEAILVRHGGTNFHVFSDLLIGRTTSAGLKIFGGTSASTQGILIDSARILAGDANGFVLNSDPDRDPNNQSIFDVTFTYTEASACEGDGYVVPVRNNLIAPLVYDITFDTTFAYNNGDDGYDISGDYNNHADDPMIFLDSDASVNGKAGIRTWHAAHLENMIATYNTKSGIATPTRGGDATNVATIRIISSTFVENNAQQINLEGRKDRGAVKIYDTIATSSSSGAPPDGFVALIYDKTGSNFSLDWDYNLFHRGNLCSAGQACARIVQYQDGSGQNGCNASELTTCDEAFTGSHPNSVSGDPQFLAGQGYHLDSPSPAWDAGEKPSAIAALSGITIFRADDFDNDGHARPLGLGHDIGAFEGPGC